MKVFRDSWGIPHLRADSVEELAYLQGSNAATDRAWQIEVERWRGEGRLAERLGESELAWDRFARRVRLDDTARRCFAQLDSDTQRWVTAYVEGVNSALPASAATAPEFAAAECEPGVWQPWSPLAVFLVQHILFGTFPTKLWRAHVAATLGEHMTGLFDIEGPDGSGSNAWATAGERPVIAGDPHRILELPGIYQQVRLACPEFDVVGLAFPGVPGIAHFGHAGDVAWAVTNAMADYQDLYREELRRDEQDVLWVREETGWAPADTHIEHIEVRGREPVPVEVIETARGPVIDIDSRSGEALRATALSSVALSLRVPARVESDLGFSALLPLLRAKNVDDVAEALSDWVEPVNSVLVADTSGKVLRLVAGRVPVRDERCRRVPVPGWDARYRWTGYADLPCEEVKGYAVTANNRRADVADLGVDFAPPYRAERIDALLQADTDPKSIHVDVQLGDSAVLRLLRGLSPADGPTRALWDRLCGWDGRMSADSIDAGAFAAWRTALARRLLDLPILRPLRAPTGFDELFTPWTDPLARIGYALDNLVTGLPPLGTDITSVAEAALAEVADSPDSHTPWGVRHVLHPIRVLPITGTKLPVVELGGDNNCVLATSSTPGVTDVCWRGPVARYVWNLANRDDSQWVVPFGASGRPDDPHFLDQLPLWTAGELISIVTNWRYLNEEKS